MSAVDFYTCIQVIAFLSPLSVSEILQFQPKSPRGFCSRCSTVPFVLRRLMTQCNTKNNEHPQSKRDALKSFQDPEEEAACVL